MGSAYPHFKSSYPHEELFQHFLLTTAHLQLLPHFVPAVVER